MEKREISGETSFSTNDGEEETDRDTYN